MSDEKYKIIEKECKDCKNKYTIVSAEICEECRFPLLKAALLKIRPEELPIPWWKEFLSLRFAIFCSLYFPILLLITIKFGVITEFICIAFGLYMSVLPLFADWIKDKIS